MKGKLLILISLVIFSACSRLPKYTPPQAKVNADETLLLAQRREHQHENATMLYENAWRQYRILADSQGQLLALAGLARLSFSQNDTISYNRYRQNMEKLVQDIAPSKNYHVELLELFRLHQKKEWNDVTNRINLQKSYPDEALIQLLSYKIQADTYLKQVVKKELRELLKLHKYYYRRVYSRHQSHPQLVSNSAYTVAFYYFTKNDFKKAHNFIKQAKEIDYHFGFLHNFAYDLWLQGKIHAAQNKHSEAKSLFNRAKIIFYEFDDEQMQKNIDKLLSNMEQ